MFREMRREDRKLQQDDAIRILAEGEYGVLACSSNMGYAYAVPLSYVYEGNAIYFHSALEGHKLDSIKSNPKVSFCVVGATEVLPEKFSTKYESVIAFGNARVLLGEEKVEALKIIIDKYSKEFTKEGMEYINRAHAMTEVVKIEIEHITAKGRR